MSSPSSPLSGRVAIVTGVSRTNGIGFAVARRLGHIGARLFLHGWPCAEDSRCEPDASEIGAVVADRLRAEGIVTQYIEHDLLDPAGPETVVRAAVEAYGHVDIVDADHAYSRDDILETLEADEIDRHLLINVRGTLLLANAFAAQHDGRPDGRFIAMTSGEHQASGPLEISYMVSKGAIHVATGMLSASLLSPGYHRQRRQRRQPRLRHGRGLAGRGRPHAPGQMG